MRPNTHGIHRYVMGSIELFAKKALPHIDVAEPEDILNPLSTDCLGQRDTSNPAHRLLAVRDCADLCLLRLRKPEHAFLRN